MNPMIHKARGLPALLCLTWLGLLPARAWADGYDSVQLTITGTLVSVPCTIPPADANISLDLGTVVNKDLLRDKRSKPKGFVLHLEECDPSVAKGVKVTFSGTASSEDKNLLSLASGSAAAGIALGIVQGKDSPKDLPLGQASSKQTLQTGKNQLDFGVYVALLKSGEKKLTPGTFSAQSTLKLTYE